MLKHIALAVLALYLLQQAFSYNRDAITAAPMEMPEVAAQLADKISSGTITARKPNIAWYLNLHFAHYPAFKWVALPEKDVVNEIRRQSIDYLYLAANEWYLRPELRPLWDPKNAPADYKLIYNRPQNHTLVYQILRSPAATP